MVDSSVIQNNDKMNLDDEKIKTKQKQLVEVMESEMKDVRYKMLYTILTEEGIDFNSEIKTYEELKKSLEKTLPRNEYKKIIDEEAEAQKEVTNFIKEIEVGGPNTIDKFVRELKTNFLRPAAQNAIMLILSRALFDAALFLPSPVNIVAGAVTLGTTILTGPAKLLIEKHAKQTKQYDGILEDIETKRDENGLTTEKRFSQQEIDVINTFFKEKESKKIHLNKSYMDEYKDIEFGSYSEMKAKISKLGNGDKFKLIGELNKLNDTEGKLAMQIAKQEITRKASTAAKVVGDVGLGLGVGVLMSNIDKEIQPLIEFLIPKKIVRSIFQNRTYYKSDDFIRSFSDAIGLNHAVGFSVVKDAVLSTINAFRQSSESKKRAEQDKDAKLLPQQKMIFEIVKHDALHKHPESVDEIKEIATLGELREYLHSLPVSEQKDSTKLLENLVKDVNRKDKKALFKELGTTLGKSVLLAGNSILLYEILLALHGSIPLLFGARGEQDSNPQQQEEPAYANEPQHQPVNSNVPQESPAIEGIPANEPNIAHQRRGIADDGISSALDENGKLLTAPYVKVKPTTEAIKPQDGAIHSGMRNVLDENGKLLTAPHVKPGHEMDVVTPQARSPHVATDIAGKSQELQSMPYEDVVKNKVTSETGKEVTIVDKSEVKDALIKGGIAATATGAAYFAAKGIAGLITVIFPATAPYTVPVIVAG